MNKGILIIIATVMVLSSFAALPAMGQFSGHQVTGNMTPSVSPYAAATGTVTIYANGTSSDSSILARSGNTYNLLTDLNGTITDMKNNSFINGNNYTINGENGNGVTFTGITGFGMKYTAVHNSSIGVHVLLSSNGTLKDLNLSANAHAFEAIFSHGIQFMNNDLNVSTVGIYMSDSNHFTISNNTYSTNPLSTGNFFYSQYSSHINISGNRGVFDGASYAGVSTLFTSYIGVYGNILNSTTTSLNIQGSNYVHSMDNVFNNIHSQALYFQVDTNFTSSNDVFSNAAGAIFNVLFVENMSLQNDNFANSPTLGSIEHSNSVSITGSTFSDSSSASSGVSFLYSRNVFLNNDSFSYINLTSTPLINLNGVDGFSLDNSQLVANNIVFSDTTISGALFSNDKFNITGTGYALWFNDNSSSDIVLAGSYIHGPSHTAVATGFYLASNIAQNITISDNTFTNVGYAVETDFGQKAGTYGTGTGVNISSNHFNAEVVGVFMTYAFDPVISYNTFNNTTRYGVVAELSSNVVITHNTIENLSLSLNANGIVSVDSYGDSVFAYNLIFDSKAVSGSSSAGIYVDQAYGPTDILGNRISAIPNGIYVLTLAFSNTNIGIFDNVVNDSINGISVTNTENLTVYGNTIRNSENSVVFSSVFTGVLYGNTISNSTVSSLQITGSKDIVVYHNNFLNGSMVNVQLLSNTQGTIAWNETLPVGGNYWSNYTGNGPDGIGSTPYSINAINTDYYPLTSQWDMYSITFVETGLPAGTTWSATLGSSTESASGSDIIFNPTNAQYVSAQYRVHEVSGYVASVSSSTMNLSGTNHTVMVKFTPYTYSVSFTESNLPSGTAWSVTLNGNTETSTGPTIVFKAANGTYNYTVGSVQGYHTSTSSGTVSVNSGSQSTGVKFVQNTYVLTVDEKGLPAGDSWNVTVNGHVYSSSGTSISVTLVSNVYTVSASGPSGYDASAAQNATIANGNATITVTFTPVAHSSTATTVAEIGGGVAAGLIAGILGAMFYTGRTSSGGRKGKGPEP